MVLMVYNQEYHVILEDYYHWEWYWKKALVALTHIQFSRERGGSKNDLNLASELIKYQSEGGKQCSVCKQRGMVLLIPPDALSEVDLELFSILKT